MNWVRKDKHELELEKSTRRLKAGKFVLILIIMAFLIMSSLIVSFSNFEAMFTRDPEKTFSLLTLPILVYLSYRSYVQSGNIMFLRPSKICLSCHKGMGGHTDDGWGFKVYGKNEKKWYQFLACKTPEKCDLECFHKVKFVNDKNKNTEA